MTSILFRRPPRVEGAQSEGVRVNYDPAQWRNHRFGLSKDRSERLREKAVWITGAGTGYGRSMAISLAAAGAQVFLTGRRRNKLEETLREAESFGIETKNCFLVEADLSHPEQIQNACRRVREQCVSLYGLIHNAAIPLLHPGSVNFSKFTLPGCKRGGFPLQEVSLESWDQIMRVNVTAPWLLTREIFPHMASGNEIRILLISSGAGWGFTSGFGPYNVSKAALNSLTGCLAEEYAAKFPDLDIQINALNPGEAKTEMNPGSHSSPYAAVSMVLLLMSHPPDGPNGNFFHRDGRHLAFGAAVPWKRCLAPEVKVPCTFSKESKAL